MDKIREEFDGVNPLYNDGWQAGQKSRDEEIKKLREGLEKIIEYTKPPMRDKSGGCYYIAEEALKGIT